MSTIPWLTVLPSFEGSTDHMYLDSVGVVTCGVGHALFSREDAVVAFADPQAADEWSRVRAMPKGHPASWYAAQTTLRMSVDLIAQRLTVDVAATNNRLLQEAPDACNWPVCVRDACLDIVYNTGNVLGFPHMVTAIRAGDWPAAAEYSHRAGISQSRNDWARHSILEATA